MGIWGYVSACHLWCLRNCVNGISAFTTFAVSIQKNCIIIIIIIIIIIGGGGSSSSSSSSKSACRSDIMSCQMYFESEEAVKWKQKAKLDTVHTMKTFKTVGLWLQWFLISKLEYIHDRYHIVATSSPRNEPGWAIQPIWTFLEKKKIIRSLPGFEPLFRTL
jgi:hypothetical protein